MNDRFASQVSARLRLACGVSRFGIALIAGLASAPVLAQVAPAQNVPVQTAPEEDAPGNGEITVTASRITRDGFEAPTPTTVLTAADIQKTAPANIADFVNYLPQLIASNSPASTYINIAGGLGGANILNLRGLGAVRTLTLLDGRRVVAASPTGVVDVNLIPSALVSRVDVVTGGASAAWGSDAVGGVVNFVLDTKFNGFKSEVQGGISNYGDVKNQKVSLTFGTDFAGGRGHVILSGFYSNVGSAKSVNSRPWYNANKFVTNPAWAAGNGQPFFQILPSVGIASATDGGLITAVAGGAPASLVGTDFNADGSTSRFIFGTRLSTSLQQGGTFSDVAGRLPLLAPVKQHQLYFRSSYDLSSSITGFVEAQFGRSLAPYEGVIGGQGTGLSFAAITVRPDNAYLPAAIAAQMPAGSSFTLGRLNFDLGLTRPVNTRKTYRVVGGLEGKLDGGWTWSAYYQYGRTDIENDVGNNPIIARLPLAADAVRVTAANVGTSGLTIGSIACRSTLTTPTNGCVPENVFGFGSPSQAARNYITGLSEQDIRLQQHVAAAQISGTPFSLWAGEVAVTAGIEHRTEQWVADSDPLSKATSFQNGNSQAQAGQYNVTEGFFEAAVPLVREVPLIKLFDINAALRYTDYSISGGVTTWKVGANWMVSDELRFRGTRSRDIRAPNLNDLFLAATRSNSLISDPQNNGSSTSVFFTSQGNLNLKPEVADAFGIGMVFRPSWLPGFSASVDYYDVSIAGAITTVTAQNTVNFCAQGQLIYCGAITRVNGVITSILTIPFNAAAQKQKGIDFEVYYRTSLDSLKLPGQIGFRLLATNVRKSSVTTGGVVVNTLGQLAQDGPPRWKGSLTTDLTIGVSNTALAVRYIGSGVVDNTYVEGGNTRLLSINNNRIKRNITFDLSETIDLNKLTGWDMQAFFVVQNLFNQAPPVALANLPGMFARQGTNPAMYDLLGRQFRGGIRFKF
jgi:iron complex outermembrane recepter protein